MAPRVAMRAPPLSDTIDPDIDAELDSALEALAPPLEPCKFEGSLSALPELSQVLPLRHGHQSGDTLQRIKEPDSSNFDHRVTVLRPGSSRSASSAALDAYCAALQLRESRLGPGKPLEGARADKLSIQPSVSPLELSASMALSLTEASGTTAGTATPPKVVACPVAPSRHSPSTSNRGSPLAIEALPPSTSDPVSQRLVTAAAAGAAAPAVAGSSVAGAEESLIMVTTASPLESH